MQRPDITRLLVYGFLVFVGEQQAQGDFLLGMPRRLGPEINSGARDATPAVSGDGRTLYFSSARPGGVGRQTLWQSTRETLDAPWNTAENIQSIGGIITNSPSVTADGLELYFGEGWGCCNFGSIRPGGQGGFDIWVSKRTSMDEPWGEPQNLGPIINSGRHEDGPSISADGLSLYFGSTRPDGLGNHDIYVARRSSRDDPWQAPVNLGPSLNSPYYDHLSSVSPDELTAFVFSNRPGTFHRRGDMWVATRTSVDEPFGTPVHFSSTINKPSGAWDMAITPDGSTLYYGLGHGNRVDIWEVPLLPFEGVAVIPNGSLYFQDFDEALGDNAQGQPFPMGWTGSENGLVFDGMTTLSFPPGAAAANTTSFLNAGGVDHADRALALSVAEVSEQSLLQLLVDVTESDATALQLQFDIEVWDAVGAAEVPGEAAFDVTLEADSGDGFVHLADLGTVSTGRVLQPPDGQILDGNADGNRISFDSGIHRATIPAGSTMRIRWSVPDDAANTGWIYGLDNVALQLLNTTTACDLNTDGVCDVSDLDRLTNEVLTGAALTADNAVFDLNADGFIDGTDRHVWVVDLKQTYFGDANLDGRFDSADLVAVFQAGEYEDGVAKNSSWSTGDWNGDAEFGSGDLVLAFQGGGYEAGPRQAVNQVPEPAAFLLMITGLLGTGLHRSRQTSSTRCWTSDGA